MAQLNHSHIKGKLKANNIKYDEVEDFFGVSKWSVSQWLNHGIPEHRNKQWKRFLEEKGILMNGHSVTVEEKLSKETPAKVEKKKEFSMPTEYQLQKMEYPSVTTLDNVRSELHVSALLLSMSLKEHPAWWSKIVRDKIRLSRDKTSRVQRKLWELMLLTKGVAMEPSKDTLIVKETTSTDTLSKALAIVSELPATEDAITTIDYLEQIITIHEKLNK